MKPVKDVAPQSLNQRKMNTYNMGDDTGGLSGQAAICEQMARMQKSVDKSQRGMDELIDMCREILKASQSQQQRIDKLVDRVDKFITRVDKAIERGDEGVQIMADSAETIRLNSDMIVKSSLMLAYVMGDEEAVTKARVKAEVEFKKWKEETSTSSNIVSLKG